ncbi:hypothetical protein V8G54_027185, partial [Vigna mungo]
NQFQPQLLLSGSNPEETGCCLDPACHCQGENLKNLTPSLWTKTMYQRKMETITNEKPRIMSLRISLDKNSDFVLLLEVHYRAYYYVSMLHYQCQSLLATKLSGLIE